MSEKVITGINSPIGRLHRAQTQKKVLTVDDPTATEEDEQVRLMQFEAARQQQVSEKQRATPVAVKSMEILTGIGRLGTKIEVDGTTFSLRSLKAKEMRAVMKAVSNAEEGDRIFEMRSQILARAIYEIDGQPVDMVLQTDDVDEISEMIQEMDELTLTNLYTKYTDMLSEHSKNLGKNLGETSEEVTENLKK